MAERSMARSEFREANYQATVDEIGVLRASDNTYEINTSYSSTTSDGHAEYVGSDHDEPDNILIPIHINETPKLLKEERQRNLINVLSYE